MIPMIGVTIRLEEKQLQLNRDYMEAVVNAGAIPVLIPYLQDEQSYQQILDQLDGLLLTGGEDVDPYFYNQDPHPELREIMPERDRLELLVTRLFLKTKKPILGLCRGMQVMNVAMGGDLYQDLPSQAPSDVNHWQKAPRGYPYHKVSVKRDTLLHSIVARDEIKTNTYHHQAVRRIPESMIASAIAPDGIIEAIESKTHPFFLGVQWHPEGMVNHGYQDPYAQKIFSEFINACKNQNRSHIAI